MRIHTYTYVCMGHTKPQNTCVFKNASLWCKIHANLKLDELTPFAYSSFYCFYFRSIDFLYVWFKI